MTQHYIHRPTPPGGETDPRFREAPSDRTIEYWNIMGIRWAWLGSDGILLGEIWRIPGSDAPTPELLALAETERNKA